MGRGVISRSGDILMYVIVVCTVLCCGVVDVMSTTPSGDE